MKGLTKFLTYVFALLLCAAAAGAVAYLVLQEKGVSFSVTQGRAAVLFGYRIRGTVHTCGCNI